MKALLSAVLLISLFLPPSLNRQSVDARMEIAAPADVWVDAQTGSDLNNGTSRDHALRTIQAAANLAGAGTTVHILPGVYRESVVPVSDGTSSLPIVFTAEAGPGTVKIRGSESASTLTWQRLSSNTIGLPDTVDPTKIYYTDISSWNLEEGPRFLVTVNSAGEISERLMPAREPDWQVETEWKMHEFWWMAEGGSAPAQCDPVIDADPHCDLPQRSFTQITDAVDDSVPAGIEPGNLTTLGNLTGATLRVMDAHHAHYFYHANIIDHDITKGKITIDQECETDGEPGLGWGSKYYIENHPALLDRPGEWWYDKLTERLYILPPGDIELAELALEISQREFGFDLTNRSNIILDGLTIELVNAEAYRINNTVPTFQSHNNIIRNAVLRYANFGIMLYQYTNDQSSSDTAIVGFLLENTEIAYIDTSAFDSSFWWPDAPLPDNFHHPGITNITIKNNELHHLGFNSSSRSAVGVKVFFPDHFRLENNHIHDVAQNGVQFQLSLADSTKEYGFSSQQIRLGDILIKDNLIERVCRLASDCASLKFGGSQRPYTHVFRDVLIIGNIFRDSVGWSDVSIKRRLNKIGDANGLYIDYASGFHAYRNIAYNNTGAGFKLACLWRDGDIIFYNNIAANNYSQGFKFTGGSIYCDSHDGSTNTQLVNNIIINNEGAGIQLVSGYEDNHFGNLVIDYNLYANNGWNLEANWGHPADIALFQGSKTTLYLKNLSEIQAFSKWEEHGVVGTPAFIDYDLGDYDRFDGSWPDFHTRCDRYILDGGSPQIPHSLYLLLARFNIVDTRFGDAYDIGCFETPTADKSVFREIIRKLGTPRPFFEQGLSHCQELCTTPSCLIFYLYSP